MALISFTFFIRGDFFMFMAPKVYCTLYLDNKVRGPFHAEFAVIFAGRGGTRASIGAKWRCPKWAEKVQGWASDGNQPFQHQL